MDFKVLCDKVCGVAREAGEYIRAQREGFTFEKVEFKGAQNLVSYVDKTAERLIVDRLRPLLPGAGFIAEEGTTGQAPAPDTPPCGPGRECKWVIDPLDGTTNFIHGLPPYCVSIGLMRGERIVVGVVYEVTADEMFYAWEGSDAFLNGKNITASPIDKLENSLVAIGFSHASNNELADFQAQIEYFQRNSNGIRRIGSAAADLAYVAAGRFEAFAQVNLSPWDVAGGALIALRAGAVVTDYEGGGDYVFGRSLIAAAPAVYGEFRAALDETCRRR